jgi:pimeloyl-ACP methyl ester carboxylesterase
MLKMNDIIKVENENDIPNSISEKVWIEVENTKLGLIIKSIDPENPVLLILGGGPGIPEYLLESEYGSNLDKYFILCYINYRGTGLSFDKNTIKQKEDLTSETYFNDCIAVAKYLCKRFHKEKIYLLGHSFGTYVGLNITYRYPEFFHAYIGMSMIVDQNLSEQLAYQYMYEFYKGKGKTDRMKELDKFKILFETKSTINFKDPLTKQYFEKVRDAYMHESGIGTTHEMKSVITGIFFPSFRIKDFSLMEKINIWRAKMVTSDAPVITDAFNFNAFETINKLKIPFYVFAGKYDYTTAYSVQEKYFNRVTAPLKKFYTFENSAHSPLFEENEKALKIILQDILKK